MRTFVLKELWRQATEIFPNPKSLLIDYRPMKEE
jgi:hypothetical protein